MSPVMEFPEIQTPYISLLVSGGHSMIVDVKERGAYEILGQSQDDAVGEAFDKVGKLLNLPYPGGPHIEKLASNGNPHAYDFPRPMMHSDNLDLSFSGLKTSVLYTVRDIENITDEIKADIAASFQQAVIDVLTHKIKKAVEELFKVEVTKVTTSIVKGKRKRNKNGLYKKSDYKKAFVSLSEDSEIQFEGVN